MLIAPKNSPSIDFKKFSSQLVDDDKHRSDMINMERFEAFAVHLAQNMVLEADTKNGKNLKIYRNVVIKI